MLLNESILGEVAILRVLASQRGLILVFGKCIPEGRRKDAIVHTQVLGSKIHVCSMCDCRVNGQRKVSVTHTSVKM
jgi:hypothetical protein